MATDTQEGPLPNITAMSEAHDVLSHAHENMSHSHEVLSREISLIQNYQPLQDGAAILQQLRDMQAQSERRFGELHSELGKLEEIQRQLGQVKTLITTR